MKPERHSYMLLAAIIILWGANWPIMKVGLDYIPPIWFATARLLLGALCLFAFNASRGNITLPKRADWPLLFSVGCLQLGGGLVLINIALMTVDADRSAILAYTTPLWVTPLAIFVLGEKISLAKSLGIILGLAGVAVLFNPAEFDFSDPAQRLGNGYLIASAMLMGLVIVHVRYHRMATPALVIMPWQMLIGGIIVAVTALSVEGVPDFDFNAPLIAVLAYNGPVASAFCFWAYQTVMRTLPATSTSLGGLGVPVAGTLFSVWFLGETLSFGKVSGLTLISLGVATLLMEGMLLKNKGQNRSQK